MRVYRDGIFSNVCPCGSLNHAFDFRFGSNRNGDYTFVRCLDCLLESKPSRKQRTKLTRSGNHILYKEDAEKEALSLWNNDHFEPSGIRKGKYIKGSFIKLRVME
jgi:hypothetical protein